MDLCMDDNFCSQLDSLLDVQAKEILSEPFEQPSLTLINDVPLNL